MLTRPRTAVAIVKLGAQGLGPATDAAKQGEMNEAMRLFGTSVLGCDFYHGMSEARQEQVRVNMIKAEFLGSGFPCLAARKVRELEVPTLLLNGQLSPSLFHRLNRST